MLLPILHEAADEMSLAKLASQWRASWLSIWRFVPFLISFVLISFVFISFGTLFLYLTWLFCVILFSDMVVLCSGNHELVDVVDGGGH